MVNGIQLLVGWVLGAVVQWGPCWRYQLRSVRLASAWTFFSVNSAPRPSRRWVACCHHYRLCPDAITRLAAIPGEWVDFHPLG
jgi:hypothetical protein